jgi:hypothetical protein
MADTDMESNSNDTKDPTQDESTSVDQEDSNNDPIVTRVRIKKFNVVVFWSYDIENDTCAICHNQLMVS